jgi:hypothetical protein
MASYQGLGMTLKYPDNWKQYGGDSSGAAFGPEGGVLNDGSGHGALAYGLSIGVDKTRGTDANALENATRQVIGELEQSNPNMKITRQPQSVKLNGEAALSTYLSNDSPGGGLETDWIVTVARPEGLVYFVCTAPERDFDGYHRTFTEILNSVRFR